MSRALHSLTSAQSLPAGGLFTASLPSSLVGSDSPEQPSSSEPSGATATFTPPAPSAPRESAALPEGFIKHYEIIRELGEGGMGTVLLARDTKLGRLVAIKLLRDAGRAASRLLAEAQATACARHDNIVIIYEVGDLDGRPYMVLEYLEGHTLRHVLSTGKRGKGRALSRDFALDIVAAVVRALAAAHKSSIVHRDLKPENIMLLDSGQVKVLDFGLARRMVSAGPAAPRPGVGTRAYMAPEQWIGGEIDERADIWAVGVLLYELLAGAHPLAPLTDERLESVADRDTPMPSLRDARPDLAGIADVVDRCLRKRREERFGSADELLDALEPWFDDGASRTLDGDVCPFAGLTAFQEADAGRFFGRERDVATVLRRLGRHALVAVAGPSGTGKSSFVRAGLIPALKRSGEEWDVVVVRPGRAPLSALREALASALDAGDLGGDLHSQPGLLGTHLRAHCRARSRRTFLFVDQFEELYTLVPDASERAAFLACLLGAADDESSPLRVVLAVRSDFLDRIVEDRHFMTRVSAGLFFLPPVGAEGLRAALTRPLKATGFRFQSEAMVADMLGELSRARSPLPLLQFSATALWEARDAAGKLLTWESYERIGGVAGALSTHADAVVAALSASDQRLCRGIFLRLVTPERTRAIVGLRELAELGEDAAAVEAVVQHLSAARLLLVDTGLEAGSAKVELVHESMIERWATLARWLEESAGDASFLSRLRAAASQWEAGGEPAGMLWRDRAAEEARAFYQRYHEERGELLGALEERYLKAVIAFSERARRRRQRQIAGAFALVCSITTLVVFLALRARTQARRADDEAARVREQNAELALQALKGRNATRILAARKSQDDPTRALAVLREVEPEDIPKDWAELVSATITSGVAGEQWKSAETQPAYAAVMSPDGSRIALAMGDQTVRILGDDLKEHACLRGHEKAVWAVTWSPDGKRIITASYDGTARIWFVDGSGDPLVLRGQGTVVNSAMLSPDGQRAVTSDDKAVRVWSAASGRELFVLRHDTEVQSAAWSPDGKRIVTATADGVSRIWSADGKGKPLLLRGHTDMVVAASFHPEGTRIATASRDRTVRVWNAMDGAELLVLRGHEEKVMSVAWSPDGKRLASASKDRTARIWRADGRGDPLVLRGHGHWVYTATWSPDGRRILTTSLDLTQRRWNLDEIVAPTLLRGHEDTVTAIVFSPDGKRVATGSSDTTVRIWNADGDAVVLRGHTGMVTNLNWSPDSTRLASTSSDTTARIWSADGSSAPIVLGGHEGRLQVVDWSPDGERLVTVSDDGIVRSWSKVGAELSRVKKTVFSGPRWFYTFFDPSGKRVLVTDVADSTVYLWNVDEGGELVALGHHESPVYHARWSPDGSRIATITKDGIARLWDARGAAAPIVIRGPKPIHYGFWSPDSQRVGVTHEDGTLRLWSDGALGEPIIRGVQGEGGTNQAEWRADGRRILTGAPDGKARLWNADGTGTPFVLAGLPLNVSRTSWSPDGTRIAVQYDDKVAWIWPDVRPFSGPGDDRLWAATSYCIPPATRVELLGVTEAEARAGEEACRRRVAEARAARAQP